MSSNATDEFLISTVDLIPTSCSLHISQSSKIDEDTEASIASIGMKARISQGINVTTAEGKSLNDSLWSISIIQAPVKNRRFRENLESRKAIGLVVYREGFIHIPAYLEEETFSVLKTIALSGRLPTSISINIQAKDSSLREDSSRGGNSITWDVSINEQLSISYLSISLDNIKQE